MKRLAAAMDGVGRGRAPRSRSLTLSRAVAHSLSRSLSLALTLSHSHALACRVCRWRISRCWRLWWRTRRASPLRPRRRRRRRHAPPVTSPSLQHRPSPSFHHPSARHPPSQRPTATLWDRHVTATATRQAAGTAVFTHAKYGVVVLQLESENCV